MIIRDYMGRPAILRRTDSTRHKYANAMAELLDGRTEYADDTGGDCESTVGAWARFGRRVLRTDSHGHTWCERWPSVAAARQLCDAFETMEAAWYCDVGDDDYEGPSIDEADAYVAYVAACASEDLIAFDYGAWLVNGRPAGPIGGAR